MTADQVCEHCPINPSKSPVQRVCWAERFEQKYAAKKPASPPSPNRFDHNSRPFPQECFVLMDGPKKHFWCNGRLVKTI